MSWKSLKRLGVCLSISVVLLACGDSDDAGSDAGVTGGTGGTTTPVDAGGTGGTSSTPTGGTGGTTMTTGGMGAPVMCDETITAETSCGGSDCPAATGMCAVSCCTTDDECGTLSAVMGAVTDCVAPVEPDPDCPDYNGANATMEGCCTTDGVTCGFISTFSNTCITESILLGDVATMAGAPCDGGDADGGT